jgi:hypothetical protein
MSEKTLYQKMFAKTGMKIAVISPPTELAAVYKNIPDGAAALTHPENGMDIIQVFVHNELELRTAFNLNKAFLKSVTGCLWVGYPKASSNLHPDINRDSIRRISNEYGLDAIFQIALNETWSSLRCKIIAKGLD